MVATTTMPFHYNLSYSFRQDGKWLGVFLLYVNTARCEVSGFTPCFFSSLLNKRGWNNMENINQKDTQKIREDKIEVIREMIQEIENLKSDYMEKKYLACLKRSKNVKYFRQKQDELEEKVIEVAEKNKNKPEYKYLKAYVKNRQLLAEEANGFEMNLVAIIISMASFLLSVIKENNTIIAGIAIILLIIAVGCACHPLIKKMIQHTEQQFYSSCLNILESE